tara:strand:+ start:1541 stop:2392 length:852 start_codon:yes stop_codon:yes gene_type:complete
MDITNTHGWNYQGYPSIIDQTNPMEEDEGEIDINFGPDPNQSYRNYSRSRTNTQRRGYNWGAAGERHSREAIEMGERLFSELDLSNTTEEQDDILRLSILYGIDSACCMRSEELSPGHHMHEFLALDDILADEGFDEEVLFQVIQNGLLNNSGFISNPARQWKGKKLYKHLEDLLNKHEYEESLNIGSETRLDKLGNGMIDVWLDNIENNDYTSYVCHNNMRKTIRQLFGSIDKSERRTPEQGGIAYPFREYWDYYYKIENETAQDVVDRWNSSYISWDGILD